ncbi:hypothetical protein CTRI78_v005334 [Colletotrichum trifolii]|uniref:Uncharacterized protein n=1 Tax=Colletotrichum trifolii TaxID=5466 RepID=A0A4R8RF66_COLTR|nr:hypothetical protein CTRI78_v005334 [Colletotrichum trifolii]
MADDAVPDAAQDVISATFERPVEVESRAGEINHYSTPDTSVTDLENDSTKPSQGVSEEASDPITSTEPVPTAGSVTEDDPAVDDAVPNEVTGEDEEPRAPSPSLSSSSTSTTRPSDQYRRYQNTMKEWGADDPGESVVTGLVDYIRTVEERLSTIENTLRKDGTVEDKEDDSDATSSTGSEPDLPEAIEIKPGIKFMEAKSSDFYNNGVIFDNVGAHSGFSSVLDDAHMLRVLAVVEFVDRYLGAQVALYEELKSGEVHEVAFENLWMMFDAGSTIYCPFRSGTESFVVYDDFVLGQSPRPSPPGPDHVVETVSSRARYSPQAYRVLATRGGVPLKMSLKPGGSMEEDEENDLLRKLEALWRGKSGSHRKDATQSALTRHGGNDVMRSNRNIMSKLIIACFNIEFDGDRYGSQRELFQIKPYDGLKDVRTLEVFPKTRDEEALKEFKSQLEENGLMILFPGIVPGYALRNRKWECVAAYTKRPLYPITCGDIGHSPEIVEQNLEKHFKLAHRWACVLLLDEADVFLAKRTKTDVKRNGLVSVFLRILEYYPGILFLTTNRVGAIDDAFRSRLHLTLYYPKLKKKQTTKIWTNNINKMHDINEHRMKRGQPPIEYDENKIIKWAKSNQDELQWNGRQIRNAFQTAIALAEFQAQPRKSRKASGGSSSTPKAPKPPVLDQNIFTKIANASIQFTEYLHETHGQDEDAMASRDQVRSSSYKKGKHKIKTVVESSESSSDSDDSSGSSHHSDSSDSESDTESDSSARSETSESEAKADMKKKKAKSSKKTKEKDEKKGRKEKKGSEKTEKTKKKKKSEA